MFVTFCVASTNVKFRNSKYAVGKVKAGNGHKTIRKRIKQMPSDFSETLENGVYTSQLTIDLFVKVIVIPRDGGLSEQYAR